VTGCCWCDTVVLNAHAPNEDKSDDTKDSFYDELERVLHQFPKILLGYFSAKLGKLKVKFPCA
jgi:hypothetical protein